MIAEHAEFRALERLPEQHDPFGRKLRNRLMLANAIAWIAIIVLIRLIFF